MDAEKTNASTSLKQRSAKQYRQMSRDEAMRIDRFIAPYSTC